MAASDIQLAAFQVAFNRLKQTVSFDDACTFQSTTLKDVWKAATEIETAQRKRRSLRNMARLKPLLEALDKYSKAIEVVCNGTPFLPWIWAPIKLMLQLANEHSSALDQLLNAYMQIAEALPRFDRFQHAFPDDKNLQTALAMVYEDILEFHRSSYQFFRRGSWHVFFDSFWKDFTVRFHGILESLARHREHVDKEASAVAIFEAKKWRTQQQQYIHRQEFERQEFATQEAIAWLAAEDRIQGDELDRLAELRQAGTCEWIFSTPSLDSWINAEASNPILWLSGIPGAGKSVLTSYLTQHLQAREDITVLYFFCNDDAEDRLCSLVLRTLTVQLLRSNPELASHVFDNYCRRRCTASLPQIRRLLPDLLAACSLPHIMIDGLDECSEEDQKAILAELLALVQHSAATVRILISSREETHISRALQKVPTISLTEKKESVNADIREYLRYKLAPLRASFGDANINKVEIIVAGKAHGMFLWVQLILTELEDRCSAAELLDAANGLPQGLHKAYGRILERIRKKYSEYSRHKSIRILEWMACSFRPLKVHEIQDGVFFEPGHLELTQENKLTPGVIDFCKPLIQIGANRTVTFVHFSVKEYILHRRSGNFIRESQAHHNVAFSCVSYLLTSFSLFDSYASEHASLLRVAHGFHNLHSYANEFWHKHLIRVVEINDESGVPLSTNLIQQLEKLDGFRKGPLSPEFRRLLLNTNILLEIEETVPALHESQSTRAFLRDHKLFRYLADRRGSSSETYLDTRKYEIENDPTILSDIKHRYQSISDQLLCLDSLPGMDDQALKSWKETYGDAPFLCRYSSCTNVLRGFSSTQKRDFHEATHIRSFKCNDEKCDFFTVGFPTKAALQRHDEIYHGNPGQRMILPIRKARQPINLRERFRADDNVRARSSNNAPDSMSQAERASSRHRGRRGQTAERKGYFPTALIQQDLDTDDPSASEFFLQESSHKKKRVAEATEYKANDSASNNLSGSEEPLRRSTMQIPEALQILKRAKDEDFRSRPSYAQVCWLDEEIYEMQLSEQDKASPTPPFELQKLRKLHEDWMRKGLNLFGKADASLHVLKSHLEFVLKRNARCLNIGSDTETSPSRDEKLVCICRSIEVGRMVTCGLCLERYHDKCLKIDGGKVQEGSYMCPICDWRVRIPRDSTRPTLEDLESWGDEIATLPFQPIEEGLVLRIINDARRFRSHIAQYMHLPQDDDAWEDDAWRVLLNPHIYLRKIEGAEVYLVSETNFFRQRVHRMHPVALYRPPDLESTLVRVGSKVGEAAGPQTTERRFTIDTQPKVSSIHALLTDDLPPDTLQPTALKQPWTPMAPSEFNSSSGANTGTRLFTEDSSDPTRYKFSRR